MAFTKESLTDEEKEAIKAAKFLKAFCDDCSFCGDYCIFYRNDGGCVFNDGAPVEWKFDHLKN